MSNVLVEEQSLQNIANSIRLKNKSQSKYTPGQMADAISNIDGTDTSDATAVASDIKSGKTAYVNGQKITGTYVPPSLDNNAKINQTIGYQSSGADIKKALKVIPELTLSTAQKSLASFLANTAIVDAPKINNTLNITNYNQMFRSCYSLKNVEVYDTGKATNMTQMFYGCSELTDESLNKILLMCINATSLTGTKTLNTIGLSSTQATKCQSLSNWEAFVAAGWSTGY